MKIFIRNIHLYLSILAGIVVFTTCFTGAILVFEEELQHTFYPKRYYVAPNSQQLPMQQLVNTVAKQLPEVKVVGIKQYASEDRTVEINVVPKKPKSGEKGTPLLTDKNKQKGGREKKENNRVIAFVNPYTAEIIAVYKHNESFFFKVMSLHRWLLAGDVGKLIVGIATLFFLFILITGIVLWWPKNKQMLVQRLKLKVNASFKRVNFDWHVVLGFYASIFLFVFAFTGLAWSFQWFNNGIFWVTNSSKEPTKAPKIELFEPGKNIIIDSVISVVKKYDSVHYLQITLPKDSLDCFQVSTLPHNAVHPSATNSYYLHPKTAQLISCQLYQQRNLGQQVRAAFKPIHVASYWGWSSKVIGFLACIIGASLPITGTIIWINRLKKQ